MKFLGEVLRAVRWHRRVFAGLAAAAAVYFGLAAVSPEPAPTVAVLAAARDLAGGSVPGGSDLRTIRLPAGAVPDGAVRPGSDVVTRVLAAPVRAGEPLTDARFVMPGLAHRSTPGATIVGYAVRIEDAEVVGLLRVGDRIDLLAASGDGSSRAEQVAAAVPVISLPHPGRDPTAGALVVVAAPPETVQRIAQAAVNAKLSITLAR